MTKLTSIYVAVALCFNELSAPGQGVAIDITRPGLAVSSRLISAQINEVVRSSRHS